MKARALCASVAILTGLTACSKFDSGRDEMSWARAALERNDRVEVVASDAQAGTFTLRVKDTGELRRVTLNELVAGPPGASGAATAPTAQGNAAAAPSGPAAETAQTNSAAETPPAPPPSGSPSTASPGDAASAGTPAASPTEPRVVSADAASDQAKLPRSESAAGASPGRLLASGPGYTIKAAEGKNATLRRAAASGPTANSTVERLHEPIICQGNRFYQIDNRNLEFDGDAVSAEDGCEIHITNSRITAKGVGVMARKASVHIENSDIEGDSGSVQASDGAQIYATSSTFKGLRRRDDNAAFHDLGGNAWN